MSGKEAESKAKTTSKGSSRWMVVALLIAAIVFLIRFIAPQTVGEQIRRHVERTLREHYPQLQISIGRGRVEPNIGLILDDIRISVPETSVASRTGSAIADSDLADSVSRSSSGEVSLLSRLGVGSGDTVDLAEIDQLIVFANADVHRLLDRKNPIVTERIRIQGLHAHAWQQSDGKFSLEQLWPAPKFGEVACPRVEIVDAQLTYHPESDNAETLDVAISEAIILKHFDEVQPTSAFAAEEPSGVMKSSACRTTIQAVGQTSFADHFKVEASLSGEEIDVQGSLTAARFSPELLEVLPSELRGRMDLLRGLDLRCDVGATARMVAGELTTFRTRTTVLDGQFRHPKSSIPVHHIRGLVECDPTGVAIQSCQAYWGDSLLKIDGSTQGYAQPLRATLNLSAFNLMLDNRLAAVLPKKLQDNWRKLQPHGLIDVPKATLEITGHQVQPTAHVICKGVDVNYEKFPYPVRQITGSLRVVDDRVKSELLSGRIGGRLMQCLFDLPAKPQQRLDRVFSVALDGPIAIDTELLQSLTPRGEETSKLETFIRSLNPMGAMHLVRGTLRTDADGTKRQDFELHVSDGSLRFEAFPYPLYNVAGDIHVVDDIVSLNDFHANNANGGAIRCNGHYRIPPKDDSVVTPMTVGGPVPSLALDFNASRIALDKSLRSSLPKPSQQTWDNLMPSGVLDSLTIQLTRQANTGPLDLKVQAQQFDSVRIGSDTVRIQPVALPYRLDIVEANVRYEDGHVRIDSVRAEHGGSFASADGDCQQLDDGRWLLSIDVHNGSRLIPDAELINALPEQMRGAIRGLNLRGPVGLSGLTETLLSDSEHPDPMFGWDLQLQLEGNRIGEVGPVHDLRGELSIKGRKDATGLIAGGEVRIDSMHVNDLQITQLRGPYQIQDEMLRLGGDSGYQQPIEGKLFEGTLRIDGDVKLSDASFDVRLALIEAKVPVLLAEMGQAKNDLTGTLVAEMALEGLLGTTDLLRGRGRATVENANLYQLPVLVQLLNVLSISPTEDVAFTNADVDFTLSEEQIDFNDLKLWGSLILLYGSGTLDRRQEMNLSFNTAVSPRNTFTRIFRPLSQQRYTLWTVDVTGPLNDPNIQRRALDGVGQTLERLFPGMNTDVQPKRKDRSASFGRMLQ